MGRGDATGSRPSSLVELRLSSPPLASEAAEYRRRQALPLTAGVGNEWNESTHPRYAPTIDSRNVTPYTPDVIRTFADRETKAIFEGGNADPKNAKRARKRLPTQLWEKARAKLDEIDAAEHPRHLDLPSNRLKKLSGDRKGQFAIWINRQYRICFTWTDGDAHGVEVVDYHD